MPQPRPAVQVAVVMEREARPNRWEEWRFRVADVALDAGGLPGAPRVLRDDGRMRSALHPGFAVELFADEGEGYYLNLTSGAPVWFVLWRIDDEDPSAARPVAVTLGADKSYDAADFVEQLRTLNVRPHVAQNLSGRRSAIDRRTTRHPGYAKSQRIRKRIEEGFGWIKTVAGLRKTKLRGQAKVAWAFTFAAAAYNLVRAPALLAAAS